MSDRCEMSDLPTEMCSHCRGLDKRPEKVAAGHWIAAKFASKCDVCDGWIREGDPIGYVEDGYWVCGRCAS